MENRHRRVLPPQVRTSFGICVALRGSLLSIVDWGAILIRNGFPGCSL